jgi:hypothetical protein
MNPAPEEEKAFVKPIQESAIKSGETYYLIDTKWWGMWKRYVGYDIPARGEKPDEMENRVLLTKEGKLRRDLTCSVEYEILPTEVWEYLFKIYGGGPSIPRKSIALGFTKRVIVEVYPLSLKISATGKNWEETIFSKITPLSIFKQVCCKQLGINHEKVRLYFFYGGAMRGQELKSDQDETLDELNVLDGLAFLFDISETNGITRAASSKLFSFGGPSDKDLAKSGKDEYRTNFELKNAKGTGMSSNSNRYTY